MQRFWIEFSRVDMGSPHRSPKYGVTARSYEEALELLQRHVFSGDEVPAPVKVVRDVDVSTLDPKHVLPNIGVPVNLGIWYPKGLH